ncbi:Carbohydrate sulfotransferase 11 [Oopsacas minuta]|uniref:Carbohydrate sulfotransferase n=1 Tax=Oopsacas minuta TaxID=111878 RepID=A0AAV7K4D2_9METZ|nr:Carbohydrate sulfotransferase 11 [Oopsacas minuta]
MKSDKYQILVFQGKKGFLSNEEIFKNVSLNISSVNQSWIDYRNNWNGKILIEIKGKQILLTDEYIEVMESKGNHPLAQVYPKFLERRNSVKEHCRKIEGELNYRLAVNSDVFFMRFNDAYEVLNCVVPKAGSHIWAIKFASMLGYDGEVTYSKFSIFEYLSPTLDTARRVQTYTKFFVYRHPLERLVSAYCDKLGESMKKFSFALKYIKQIITVNYLENNNTKSENYAKLSLEDKQEIKNQQQRIKLPGEKLNITFLEFVTWVTSFLDKNILYELDNHWTPITYLCNPCVVNYDILIDHDFFNEESQILVDHLQKNKESNPPIYFEKYQRKATREKCNEYFRDIPQNLREKLHEIFLDDFIIFGYSYNGDSQDYACDEKIAK